MPKTYNKKVKGLDLNKYTEVEIYKLVLDGTISRFPKDFFNCDEASSYIPKITRYFIEEKLKWSKEDVAKKLTAMTFRNNKLAGLISIVYNDSTYQAIADAYGEDYLKPWEFINAPNDYWQGENGAKNGYNATKWLFEEKLKWSEEDIRNKLNKNVFVENNLLGMIKKCYHSSMFECINAVYPDKFMPWEIGCHVANNYWDEEKCVKSIKWLIEDKLKWNKEDIKNNLSKQIFIDNNLYGMIQKYFNASPFQAIDSVYPGMIKPWELKTTPQSYWNEETSKLAINWLVKEKLNWDKEYAKSHLKKAVLKKYGLHFIMENYTLEEILELID